MTAVLLDANVLIAAVFAEHEHHERAVAWLSDVDEFAVCPIVEGALIRFALRVGESAATASALVSAVRTNPRCGFWADDVSYSDVDLGDVLGHRQVTDTYLVALAGARGARLATFDLALQSHHPEATIHVP